MAKAVRCSYRAAGPSLTTTIRRQARPETNVETPSTSADPPRPQPATRSKDQLRLSIRLHGGSGLSPDHPSNGSWPCRAAVMRDSVKIRKKLAFNSAPLQ
jgi:hypothetical protein